jgi:Protein of unknown function (DUF3224)
MKANGSFELASWQEDAYEELGGDAKLTHASVTQTFTGDVEGDGAVQWLMAYRGDGTAHFVGLQRIRGSVRGRQGAFVLETVGDFDGHWARWEGSVVRGTATGELEGLSGRATFGAPLGSTASFEFEYSIE